ncbi:MAG: membrane protein insertase YidC [Epsilonproteobacteria bacterium]|nr:membrane protein insertase YidC [Campylobacterota bacterium]PIP09900.1 MAG: membrane protein insertase YidC [Sulfurimonas sp. CG23_combo_of_CG06-09_8_20_14_all_36_33]PIS24116.1 MAG: membrane protein insertase YidC [Sulfurimonas sp. CG08_land_8_20_14_0_20_36_33]PIU35600.1 MAG: membrane protein insertase YidC [Sulfurimonas sp. CG07_land_8_20_14_0_80_36_56]PIV05521.1 MAG: membrane protein insertase YidC [Sulfurimonas sp. CG03_land_8_20_14_0_80_36_25]PIV37163.1 MAG: membrane protein insertase Y
MTSNQRLMLAVALSITFFVAYTAIFPPVEPKKADAPKSQNVALTKDTGTTQAGISTITTEQATGHAISQEEKIAATASSNIVTVKSKEFILKIDTLGRISSKELLQAKYNDGKNEHSQLIPPFGTKPLFVRFLEDELNKEAASIAYTASISEITLEDTAQKVILTQKLPDLVVTKKLTFYPDGHYDAVVTLSKDKRYFIYLGQRPEITEQMMTVSGAMIYTDDELVTIIEDGDAEGRKTFTGVELISAFDQYSATIMYEFSKDTNIVVDRDKNDNPIVYFEALQKMNFKGYVGQKNYEVLEGIKPVLTNAIEYGWFTFASKPLFQLLSWLHGIFGNWGWSIIALTILVRVVLYPLTYKGMVSMQKIKEIAPKIKEVQAKYKGDPQRMNAAVMDMYKKHGANPLGGCLPMLLQIPVFFAIYRVLLNAVELQGAPWALWITDLSRMDTYYILPILMGASMYYQQKLTPNNFTDPMQEKVFKFLPVIFTFFFLTFPSGLVLYWFVNNLFSIAQQFIVNQQFKNAKDAQQIVDKHQEKKEITGNKDD